MRAQNPTRRRVGSRVVRAHAMNAVDPSWNPAGGAVLYVTPPISLPFTIYPLSNKGVDATHTQKKSLNWQKTHNLL